MAAGLRTKAHKVIWPRENRVTAYQALTLIWRNTTL